MTETGDATITQFLADDHNRCDDLFAAAENAVSVRDWASAAAHFQAFLEAMRRHFAMEEDILFPAFETRAGSGGGPTFVMRGEHREMNGLLDEMGAALERREQDAYLNLSETLLMLMRQHNLKEENILYPMTDHALAGERSELLGAMRVR